MGRGNPRAFEGKRESTQFKAIGEEQLVNIGTRLPPSLIEKIEANLKPGESKSSWIREAITTYLAQRSSENCA